MTEIKLNSLFKRFLNQNYYKLYFASFYKFFTDSKLSKIK